MIEIDEAWLARHPLPEPGADTDKNKRGRVLIAGGSLQVPGALRLTGEAAFRAGAGKVQLATVEAAALPLGMGFPEAAVIPLPANRAGELGSEAAAPLAALIERCDALVLGPGMGAEATPEPMLRAVLANAPAALLLDAAMIGAVPAMEGQVRETPGSVTLTPHPGEMAALMKCDEADVSPALAHEAADRLGAIVVLKRSDTHVAAAGAEMLHYPGGGPGLATGGSGDVLAGLIGGMLARGVAPQVAAGWGVWLHGEAGRLTAEAIGPLGFLARELLGRIPGLMARAG